LENRCLTTRLVPSLPNWTRGESPLSGFSRDQSIHENSHLAFLEAVDSMKAANLSRTRIDVNKRFTNLTAHSKCSDAETIFRESSGGGGTDQQQKTDFPRVIMW
jgi:hypothetical protein